MGRTVSTSEKISSQLENKLSSLCLTEDLSVTTHQVLQKGWALKVPKRETRFPDKVGIEKLPPKEIWLR